ncbi:neutral/alkaline non-lysosomal ceramidase N-terminal domain-containing protein [Candidatus Uabimicrobium sp. HlEnr_7]|uniref:neutral/alkaline non-lysosomal ceramidase N-terminal domain-containing protein n=1 Tax=Candidatus Uabimicrobium helgolandensis TaxID=3095367 RepID=UPI003557F980
MRYILTILCAMCLTVTANAEGFLVGTGIYDVTGPAGDVTMAGFARMEMKTGGIHTRLRSRAYVIEADGKRVAFVCSDLWAIPQGIKIKVVEKLQQMYGDTYNVKNVMLNANHTHSGPGGYAWYTLYNTYVLGFSQRNFDTIVDGICESISRAHNNIAPAKIFMAQGELKGAAVNRSLEAYMANVDANLHTPIDEMMTVLKFQRLDGKEIGMISWFGVHTTSIFFAHPDAGNPDEDNTNRLVSSDNKGWAERLFEMKKGTDYTTTEDTFVAAFANSTLGDVSANTVGNMEGGGVNDYASCAIAGKKQFDKAWELYQSATTELKPVIHFRHMYTDFSDLTVKAKYTDGLRDYKTTFAALGINFTAGVERDGPSNLPYIKEGLYKGKYDSTHGTKIIFLETGKFPTPWTPEVLPIQMFTIGNLGILGVPAETTTHAGRRMRKAAKEHLQRQGVDTFIIASPTNAFSNYVATREEYNQQHYEGASTLFGQWTCGAYQQLFAELAESIANNTQLPSGPTPRDLTGKQTPLDESTYDEAPIYADFGDVAEEMPAQVERMSVASMTFWGANPRNTFKTNDSFFVIERKEGEEWLPVKFDYDLDTAFLWNRIGQNQSQIQVIWDIPADAPLGTYRIIHSGKYKDSWTTELKPYSGISNEFEVTPSKNLWISHCYKAGNTIHFRLEYPGATQYDLLHKTKYVNSGIIRFTANGNRDKVYEAKPSKKIGSGYFSAQIDTQPTTINVPQNHAQDEHGNGNAEFSTGRLHK